MTIPDSVLDELSSYLLSDNNSNKHMCKKCITCKTVPICNVIPTILDFVQLGIIIDVVECPYSK